MTSVNQFLNKDLETDEMKLDCLYYSNSQINLPKFTSSILIIMRTRFE